RRRAAAPARRRLAAAPDHRPRHARGDLHLRPGRQRPRAVLGSPLRAVADRRERPGPGRHRRPARPRRPPRRTSRRRRVTAPAGRGRPRPAPAPRAPPRTGAKTHGAPPPPAGAAPGASGGGAAGPGPAAGRRGGKFRVPTRPWGPAGLTPRGVAPESESLPSP